MALRAIEASQSATFETFQFQHLAENKFDPKLGIAPVNGKNLYQKAVLLLWYLFAYMAH
jgi:hypothetical protein